MSDLETESHGETLTMTQKVIALVENVANECDMALSQAWDDFDAASAQQMRLWESREVWDVIRDDPDFDQKYRTVMGIADWGVIVRGAKVDRLGNDLMDACVMVQKVRS
jgi:hypothetical protein